MWAGYSGTGFGAYINPGNDYLEWTIIAPTAGRYQLGFRYALGSGADRPLQIQVNGSVVNRARSFPSTTTWTNWQTVSTTVLLAAGPNKVRATAIGRSGANVDRLEVRAVPPVVDAEESALKATTAAQRREMTLFPNPATRSVTVSLPGGQADEIAVRDLSGRVVRHFERISGQAQVAISLGSLPAGLYTILIRSQQQVYVKRLVKLQE